MLPIEIRIRKLPPSKQVILTIVFEGVGNVYHEYCHDWKLFIQSKGWNKVPRIWE